MSSSERAAGLRAQADALDALADLEDMLLTAKAAYAADPSPENLAVKAEAAIRLREAREISRQGRSGLVGGDAFISGGED